jgi:hypothetical protein
LEALRICRIKFWSGVPCALPVAGEFIRRFYQ